MDLVENNLMNYFFYFVLSVIIPTKAQDLSLWNKTLEQVSGPKNCPQGNLSGSKTSGIVRVGERMFYVTDVNGKIENTNIPGCVDNFKTTFDTKKNEFIKKAKISKCIQPMDDMEYDETLRLNLPKKTLKYTYSSKKTELLVKKFICRYIFR